MKLFKSLALAGALLFAGASTAQADGYNRIGISYDNTSYGFNKHAGGKNYNFSTNGFGLNYIHGFEVSDKLPLFVETGLNVNFNFANSVFPGEKDYYEDNNGVVYYDRYNDHIKYQFINFQLPVNFGYRFQATPDFSIAPYIGLNFKLNIVGKAKYELEYETTLPDSYYDPSDWEEIEDYLDGINDNADWESLYSTKDMGSKDATWNRFQLGWHIGVGFQYKPYYLGIQYGTDFVPAYSAKKAKVNTGNLKITLGYNF